MKHKWHDEIVAWAAGKEIEYRWEDQHKKQWSEWETCERPKFYYFNYEFRIKPTPKESEFAHIPYWLCCGSLDSHHHNTSCYEAKAGYPERCRFGTIAEHKKRMEKPTPKEPQYLYVYQCKSDGKYEFTNSMIYGYPKNYIGKIKLEVDDAV